MNVVWVLFLFHSLQITLPVYIKNVLYPDAEAEFRNYYDDMHPKIEMRETHLVLLVDDISHAPI